MRAWRIKDISHGVLDGIKWIMFHDKPYNALGPSKGGGSNVKLGILTSNWIAIGKLFLKIFHYHGRVLDYWLLWIEHKICCGLFNMIHFYFTPSLRAHRLQNLNSIYHNTMFQGPLNFHGHYSRSICKATLVMRILLRISHRLRGWSHRPLLTPSVSISTCNSVKSDGPPWNDEEVRFCWIWKGKHKCRWVTNTDLQIYIGLLTNFPRWPCDPRGQTLIGEVGVPIFL